MAGSDGGSFVNNGATATTYFTTDWHVAGIGDFNGDGRDDFLLRNDAGYLTEWLGGPNGGFVNNGANATLYFSTDWKVAGIGDFNGDGRADFILRNDNGYVTEWLGAADGSFVNNSGNVSFAVSTDWTIAGVGDFNNDGRADVLVRYSDGTITDWLGQSNGGFVDNSTVAWQPLSTDYQVAGVGDFNGDGFSDVLLRNIDGTLETWVGATNGNILSPMEKLWQDAIANAAEFVDEVASHLIPDSPDGGAGGPSLIGYAAVFGPSFPTANEMDPGGILGLFEDNREFTLRSFDPSGFSALFDFESSGSMTQLDLLGNIYVINVNGTDLIAEWHSGPPPAPVPSSDSIVITGHRNSDGSSTPTGFFLFDPTVNGFVFNDGHGGGPRTAVTGPAAFNIADATPSPEEQAAARLSLNLLYSYSPTAKALIDAAIASGVTLNLLTADVTTGQGQQDGFYAPGTANPLQLYWDPFEVITGTNSDGSTYVQSPIMNLAHELVHAGHAYDPTWQGAGSEAAVMALTNQIAAELNAATHSHFDTTRDNHVRTGQWDTDRPTSTVPSIVRPGH